MIRKIARDIFTKKLKFPVHKYDQLSRELLAYSAQFSSIWNKHQRAILKRIRTLTDLSISLGSGTDETPGWILIDIPLRGPENYLRWDCRRRLPFRDSSAARILIEHYFEHLDPDTEVPRVLSECRRILQPGGFLRIIVPDAERFLRAYVSGRAEDWSALGFKLDALPPDLPTPMTVVNHVFHQRGEHKAAYDYDTLRHVLQTQGFTHISRKKFGESDDPGMTIDRPNHAPYSLYVECRKPA